MTDYNKLTVAKLKDLLKERGIPATGLKLKAHFVEALEKADGAEDAPAQDAPTAPENGSKGEDTAIAEKEESQPGGEINETGATRSDAAEAQKVDEDVGVDHSAHSDAQAEPAEAETEEKAIEETESSPAPAIAAAENVIVETTTAEAPTPAAEPMPLHETVASLTQISTTGSTATEELVEDRLKRKRRSATPPISESEVVKKKLRQDTSDGTVHLREDQSDLALDEGATEETNTVTADVDMKDHANALPDVANSDKPSTAPKEREGRYKDLLPPSMIKSTPTEESPQASDQATAPALHPASSAIYIRGLQRPLNPSSLRAHLSGIATPPGSKPESTAILAFFVDSVKSHAFVSFDSLASAARARANLHDRPWPAERDRKPLWVDFIPEEKVDEWIGIERESESGGRGGSKRWEVSYDEHEDGLVAQLVELGNTGTARQGPPTRRPTEPDQGLRRQVSPARRSPLQDRRVEAPRAAAPPLREAEAKKFINLDKAFRSTTTKPKLYFLPVSQDLVDKRLDEFDDLVSRDWSAKRAAAANEEELRRYTFEDGDVLVDAGFHPIPGRGRGRGGFGGGGPSRRGGYGRADAGHTSYRPR